MIPRLVEPLILHTLVNTSKIIILYGPRQAGKTTLLLNIKDQLEQNKSSVIYLNCDLEENRSVLNTTSFAILSNLLKNINFLLIDETQRLDNPGLTLKIINDNLPQTRVLATGSSSFQLKNNLSDALTGRYLDFSLYPLSVLETRNYQPLSLNPEIEKKESTSLLPDLLLYGLYPEIFLQKDPAKKQLLLTKIIESYLFTDILNFQKVRHSQELINLTRAIAYQVGSEVNENELANRLKINRKTVVRYLDLLEQTFVIIKVHPFSKNPRREIGRNYKIFFLDTGLRNALISDFNPLEIRSDVGSLWENFVIAERIKKALNSGQSLRFNFWRTYGGAEIDWIEQYPNQPLKAFECKYHESKPSRGSLEFQKEYQIPVSIINRENFLDFI